MLPDCLLPHSIGWMWHQCVLPLTCILHTRGHHDKRTRRVDIGIIQQLHRPLIRLHFLMIGNLTDGLYPPGSRYGSQFPDKTSAVTTDKLAIDDLFPGCIQVWYQYIDHPLELI